MLDIPASCGCVCSDRGCIEWTHIQCCRCKLVLRIAVEQEVDMVPTGNCKSKESQPGYGDRYL